MSGLFGNFNGDPRMQKAALNSKFNAARLNLLLVVVFTVINIITLSTGVGGYFLFSASIPYLVANVGMILCGRYPEEYYAGINTDGLMDKSHYAFFIAIAIILTSFYVLCWIFSKKRGASWLKFALVMFSIDSVVLLLTGNVSTLIFDAVLHGWVIYALISGIKAYNALEALPSYDEPIEAEYSEFPDEIEAEENIEE